MTEKITATILVVDDESDLREIITDILEGEFTRVLQAENGEEALAIVKSEKIDAVLSDIKMPRMDGLDFLAATRALNYQVPFIFLSAHADKKNAIKALRLGALDLLEKPFDTDALVDKMREAAQLGIELRDFTNELDSLSKSKSIEPEDKKKLESLLLMKKQRKARGRAA